MMDSLSYGRIPIASPENAHFETNDGNLVTMIGVKFILNVKLPLGTFFGCSWSLVSEVCDIARVLKDL